MSRLPTPLLPIWRRFAALLGLLAVLAALFAPVAMLAQDVQSGALAGLCKAALGSGDAGESSAQPHCDLCGSAGLALAPPPLAAPAAAPGSTLADADVPADTGAAVPGLPFSRGPPVLI